jgi:hypothetical protein
MNKIEQLALELERTSVNTISDSKRNKINLLKSELERRIKTCLERSKDYQLSDEMLEKYLNGNHSNPDFIIDLMQGRHEHNARDFQAYVQKLQAHYKALFGEEYIPTTEK